MHEALFFFFPPLADWCKCAGILLSFDVAKGQTHPQMSHLYSLIPRWRFTWFLASPSCAVAKLQILHMKGLDPGAESSTETQYHVWRKCVALLIKHEGINAEQKCDFASRIVSQCRPCAALLVLGEDVGPLQCYKKQEALTSSP